MPVHRLDGTFLDYAITNSSHFPSLHFFTCMRAEAFSNFIRITLKDGAFPPFKIQEDKGARLPKCRLKNEQNDNTLHH
jgi:hypothetical protein